ncbi:SDR family oxidoreductase [Candidatus Pelagibacter sp.]|nr:SDR family oxidoreductase [Candidatus Pelagibacter sp.]
MKKKVFVTGGAGYVGSRLIEDLKENYDITVFDTLYFGKDHLDHLSKKINIIKGDIRDTEFLKKSCAKHDIFIHLACISNDASFALNEKLSKSVNLDSFEPMVVAAKSQGIKRFIYASTSSVYGISEEKNVREDHALVPLTLYNKFKGMCEPILLKYTDNNFTGVIFRPATVCGYSSRQRLDLSVNILTNFAINKNKIVVFGGNQLRPNLHIIDYIRAVKLLIEVDKNLIKDEIFNVGYQNLSINQLAGIVKKVVEKEFPGKEILIEHQQSDDKRSYHINSDKIKTVLNFEPEYTIEDAVKELCEAFKKNNLPNSFDDVNYFNVKKMLKLNIS